MTVEIKRPGGTEIVLTGPGAEVCVVLNTLLDRKKPETASTSGVKLTEEEDSAMKRRNKRYICPKCAEATRRTSALRRHRSRQMGVLEYERANLREVWPESAG